MTHEKKERMCVNVVVLQTQEKERERGVNQ